MTSIEARVVVQYLDRYGHMGRRMTSKKRALVVFGRDENKMPAIKIAFAHGEINLVTDGQVKVLGENVREGKASICFIDQKVNVFISSAPPKDLFDTMTQFVGKLKESCSKRHAVRGTLTKGMLPSKGIRNKFTGIQNRSHALSAPSACTTGLKTSPVRRQPRCFTQTTPPSSCSDRTQSSHDGNPPKRSKLRSPGLQRTKGITLAQRLIAEDLTDDQKAIFTEIMQGRSVFFTGNAGTGKTFLMQKIIEALPKDTTFATASTGVAACAIAGMTLHSFAGIQPGSPRLPSKTTSWLKAKTLLIDEISMVDSDFFDQLERTARAVRRNKLPFGGIQLVLVGDFLQLPPVQKKGGDPVRFCFEATSWNACIHKQFELKKILRQADNVFASFLHRCRIGATTHADVAYIQKTANHRVGRGAIRATKLCTHIKQAEAINAKELKRLPGPAYTFTRTTNTREEATERNKSYLKGDAVVILKKDAQVMLTANLNVADGLANGMRGIVVGVDAAKWPIVEFVSGLKRTIRPHTWTTKTPSGMVVESSQVPLTLAWAISVHKSQGMTLDALEVDLAKVFEYGQAYVALSRAKTYEGLCVRNFKPNCMRAHPRVVKFYETTFS